MQRKKGFYVRITGSTILVDVTKHFSGVVGHSAILSDGAAMAVPSADDNFAWHPVKQHLQRRMLANLKLPPFPLSLLGRFLERLNFSDLNSA